MEKTKYLELIITTLSNIAHKTNIKHRGTENEQEKIIVNCASHLRAFFFLGASCALSSVKYGVIIASSVEIG